MKKIFTFLFVVILLHQMILSQTTVDTLWTKTYGGSSIENIQFPYTMAFTKTSMVTDKEDNIFIVTTSASKDGDVGAYHGGLDSWILKLNSKGDTLWTKVLGGSADDVALGVAADQKGGCIVVGTTASDDGSFQSTGHYGEVGEIDGFVAVFGSDGSMSRLKQYGSKKFLANFTDGTSDTIGGMDALTNIIPTSDGNYMCVGYTDSYDNDLGPLDGSQAWAGWFLKIDPTGKKISSKKISSDLDNLGLILHYIYEIVETEKGDFICLGEIFGTTSGYWVFRTDGIDNTKKTWNKIYKTGGIQNITSLTKKDKDTYVGCGWITANNGDVTERMKGGIDTWVFEIDAETGDLGKQRIFGGSQSDMPKQLIRLKNGNMLLCGSTNSFDGDAFGGNGADDFWLLELDNNLDTLLMHKFGGSYNDELCAISESQDGSAIYLVGGTESNDFYINKNQGYTDIWVSKIKENKSVNINEINNTAVISCYPNPSDGVFNIFNAKGKTIQINDIIGREIFTTKLNSDSETLDLTSFPGNIYFINSLDDESLNIKIIKL